MLSRNGLVSHQDQQHKRKYRRWQRDAPMQLWQMDIVSGVFLAHGRECKLVTGIDDHSRFLVVAEVVLRPTGRDVCSAFVAAMQRYGVPTEMLTDYGKQSTGRFTKPRPAEVLFERVCRENGIVQRLTKRRSPTMIGKIERFHRTLRQEFLDHVAPFESVVAAQEAINTWVHTYNHSRPHQSLDMATPASRFRPSKADAAASLQGSGQLPLAIPRQSTAPNIEQAADPDRRPASAGAVEFDVVVPPCGHFALSHGGQDIWIGPAFAGKTLTSGRATAVFTSRWKGTCSRRWLPARRWSSCTSSGTSVRPDPPDHRRQPRLCPATEAGFACQLEWRWRSSGLPIGTASLFSPSRTSSCRSHWPGPRHPADGRARPARDQQRSRRPDHAVAHLP
ncbi:integrase core domain-containing protein [Streptomyces sp. NPDC006173]|uniref:integrase core domain-containing protein n=1 Tax=Streptomyces sp. NPDC006173 TaxID=3155349 RepID=UPI0033D49CF3